MNNQQPNPFPELEALKQKAQRATDPVERLQLMKQWIDKAKIIQATGEGQVKQIENQRAQEFGCPTNELAADIIRELEEDVARLAGERDQGVVTLMEEMRWES